MFREENLDPNRILQIPKTRNRSILANVLRPPNSPAPSPRASSVSSRAPHLEAIRDPGFPGAPAAAVRGILPRTLPERTAWLGQCLPGDVRKMLRPRPLDLLPCAECVWGVASGRLAVGFPLWWRLHPRKPEGQQLQPGAGFVGRVVSRSRQDGMLAAPATHAHTCAGARSTWVSGSV